MIESRRQEAEWKKIYGPAMAAVFCGQAHPPDQLPDPLVSFLLVCLSKKNVQVASQVIKRQPETRRALRLTSDTARRVHCILHTGFPKVRIEEACLKAGWFSSFYDPIYNPLL